MFRFRVVDLAGRGIKRRLLLTLTGKKTKLLFSLYLIHATVSRGNKFSTFPLLYKHFLNFSELLF